MQTLTIHYPTDEVELLPVPRSRLKALREHFVALQSVWLETVFSVPDVMADEEGWQHMQAIAALLPHAKNPALTGFDLDALSNDYEQLEQLFFADNTAIAAEQLHGWNVAKFSLDAFVGSTLLSLHRFNCRRVLEDAEALRQARLGAKT